MNEKNVDEKKFETKIKKKSMKKILEISIMDKNETVQKREKNTLQNTHKSNTMHDIMTFQFLIKERK